MLSFLDYNKAGRRSEHTTDTNKILFFIQLVRILEDLCIASLPFVRTAEDSCGFFLYLLICFICSELLITIMKQEKENYHLNWQLRLLSIMMYR